MIFNLTWTNSDGEIISHSCSDAPALDENCKIEGPFSIETATYFLELRHHGNPRHRFTGNVDFWELEKTSHLVIRSHWRISDCTPRAPPEIINGIFIQVRQSADCPRSRTSTFPMRSGLPVCASIHMTVQLNLLVVATGLTATA